MTIGKVIVCDRSKPQTNAIKRAFKDSNIIYCEVHVMRNIRGYCGINSKLFDAARKMFINRTEKYEGKYQTLLNSIEESEFKRLLIEDMKMYLPSHVDRL